MIRTITKAAGQNDPAGSLLETDLRFDQSETFATRPISGVTGSALDAAGSLAAATATGGDATSEPASLAGTTVQMGVAGGLVFNITFDSSVSSAPAGFTSAIAAVVNYYTNVFNDPITINIDVGWGEVAGQALASGALGESQTNLGVFSYSQVKTALAADAKSADDTTAVASLASSDPTNGGSFALPTAEAKALGLGAGAIVDGYVGFSSSASYTFDPNNRAVSGAYDFIGVAEHEISEVMGRVALLGTPLSGLSHTYTALDLFRYSNPGVRQLTAGNSAYFSLDGGNTNLNKFNTLSNGDAGDWASGSGNDSYNAFVSSGVAEPVTANDLRVLDAIGWDRSIAKVDTPPVVTVTNSSVKAGAGQIFAAASLFSASDPDGDAITQYDFWDTGGGGGHFLVNGVTQPTNGDIYVTASQLAQTTYQSGNGTDILWVRANDGTQWSVWSASFTVSAQSVGTPPVVTVTNSNLAASAGQIFAASSLFTATDPDGDTITQYDFWDTGSGGGHFLVNGVTQPTNADIYVPASQLSQTTYQSGNGTDTLWVRANDGTQWSAWSASFTVSAQSVGTPPVVTVNSANIVATPGQVFAASSLFTASDPDGDAITQYDFWDTGGGGGRFLVNGVTQPINGDIYVPASQLSQTTYQSGTGSDTLWVRANDGSQWNAWSSSFTVTGQAGGSLLAVGNLGDQTTLLAHAH
jgi:hypothetical protein